MKLLSFSATNYRSITKAHKIKFTDKTVLIGRNNEGKSNLLRALETAMVLIQSHGQSQRNIFSADFDMFLQRRKGEIYEWKRDFPIQLQNRKTASKTILKVEFQLDDGECIDFRDAIGTNLNGSLPLEITIGRDPEPDIRVVKSGKGAKSLTSKSSMIADFVAKRIHFNYIPAIRTDSTTIDLVNELLSRELTKIENNPEYIAALETITKIQQPVLEELAHRIQGPLKEFLPSISSVKLDIPASNQRYALRRNVNIVVDDGTPTSLQYKGDGVKSLAALGLIRHQNSVGGASILAIEEPESHLHPAAIHQVNEIIESISQSNQVILTTHNPLFVDRGSVKSNIIVTDGSATPAKNIGEIREILGVKASDNLTHANYALIVEGKNDALAVRAILSASSEKIAKALKNNLLSIEPLDGAGSLAYKLSLLRNSLCATYVFLDADEAGRAAINKAMKEDLLKESDYTLTSCHGMPESEFEDCINLECYSNAVREFGIDLNNSKFRGNKKWSNRLNLACIDQGKAFSDELCGKVKNIVSIEVSKNPKSALHEKKRNSFDALISGLENMIKM